MVDGMGRTLRIDRPRTRADVAELIAKSMADYASGGGGEMVVTLTEVDDREDDLMAELGFMPGRDTWQLQCPLPPRSSSNVTIRQLTADDRAVVDRLLRLVPDWRFTRLLDDHRGVRVQDVMAYTREGRVAAFAVMRLVDTIDGGRQAHLCGFGVLPEYANVARAAAASLMHGVLRVASDRGAGVAVAEVPPGEIEAVTVLEITGFRYASASRRYHRDVC